MKQTIILIIAVVVVVGGGYWLLTQNAPNTTPDAAADPSDTSTSPAAPSSDDVADVPTVPDTDTTPEYIGLSETEAATVAETNNVPFRVVERDGEMLPTTRDYRPGRINAVVEDGVVVSFTVEGRDMDKGEMPSAPEADSASGSDGAHDAIIGMTVAEAEAYAAANEVPFRIGSVDGEARPVTMDYRPGRITASVVDDIVTDYSVE